MTALLEVTGLGVSFGLPNGGEARAVRDVSFTVSQGERFGLVGESGCGKTTVLMALMGLLPGNACISGSIRFQGKEVLSSGGNGLDALRWTDVALVPQGSMNAFSPVARVGWQIAEPIVKRQRESMAAARKRVSLLLSRVGLDDGVGRLYPHQLSGGMKQRAAIAMALACGPKLVLADEPTTALDVLVQRQVSDLLVELSEESGLALILVSHDLPLVLEMCTRAAIMYAGRIVEESSAQALSGTPQHPYTRALIGAIPDIRETTSIAAIPGHPPPPDRPIEGCAFAPRCADRIEACSADPDPIRRVNNAACHRVGYAGRDAE